MHRCGGVVGQRVLQQCLFVRRVFCLGRRNVDLAVGHQAGHVDVAADGDAAQQHVADGLDALAQATGQEDQHDQQTGAGEDQLVLGEAVAQDLDESDAHEDTGDGTESTDHGHGEDDQAVGGVEGAQADGAEQGGVEATGHPGHHAGQDEATELDAHSRHRHGRSGLLVVARAQQYPTRAGASQPLNEEDGHDQNAQTEEVVRLVAGQIEALPQHAA